MKNLHYKEFRLAMHPVCWVFVILFPLMIFIPNYPLCTSFIYVATAYPILFLGANKGVQTNDLLFSVLLPVRKKDIVLARMITCSTMQFVSMTLAGILSLFARRITIPVPTNGPEMSVTVNRATRQMNLDGVGFGFNEMFFIFSFVLLAFCVYDFLYFVLYYRKGKSVLLPTFLGLFIFIAIVLSTTIILPLASPAYNQFFVSMATIFRAIFFVACLSIYALCHYLTYRLASKLLEKVNF